MAGSEMLFPEFQCFLEKRQGQVQLPNGIIRQGLVVHARERVGMEGAELRSHEVQRLREERHRQVLPTGRMICPGQAAHAGKGVRMPGSEMRLPEFQCFLEKRQGQVQLSGSLLRHGEVVHGGERVGIIGAKVLAVQRRGAIEETNGAFVSSHAAIRVADRLQNLGLDQRLVGEIRVDRFRLQFVGGTVQQFANGRVLRGLRGKSAAIQQRVGLVPRVGLAEQLDLQEVPHRPGNPLFLVGLDGKRRRDDRAGNQRHYHRGRQPCHDGLPPAPAPGMFPAAHGPGKDRPAFEVTPQILGQRLRGRIPPRDRFLQALQHDRFQVARDGRVELPQRHGVVFDHLLQGFQRRGSLEGRSACEGRVEQRAQGIDVGRWTDGVDLPGRLLGRHVAGRAQDLPRGRQVAAATRYPRCLDPLGQAEIGHPRAALAVDEDVRGLDVAMDHALPMGIFDGLGHRGHQFRRFLGRQRPLGQPGGQALTVDVAHREVVLSLVLADLENRHDVGMVEQGRRLRLGMKAIVVGFRGQLSGENHFHRDDAVERNLAGLVDHAHAAAGDLVHELIIAQVADAGKLTGGRRRTGRGKF